MKKEDFTALGIDESTAEKCAKACAEELKGFIPKARFDEVNSEKKNLETALSERDKQLESLKSSAGNVDELKKQIETLQAQNKEQTEKHAAEINALKVDNAVESALNGVKAKNHKAVKALLSDILAGATLGEDGTVKGLSDKLKEVQKSDPYLFESAPAKQTFKGVAPAETGVDGTPADTSKMSYEQLCAYIEANPGVNLEQA